MGEEDDREGGHLSRDSELAYVHEKGAGSKGLYQGSKSSIDRIKAEQTGRQAGADE
jgi:hypothetical protein